MVEDQVHHIMVKRNSGRKRVKGVFCCCKCVLLLIIFLKDIGNSKQVKLIDFVDAIETGKRPTCDVQIGHDATNMSLLGMLSLKLGRSIQWDGAHERVVGDDEANRLLSRPYENGWSYPGTA